MANEELIYRITRAIYERLGTTADESAVEQLVTDIYQQSRRRWLRMAQVQLRSRVPARLRRDSDPRRLFRSLIISVFGWIIRDCGSVAQILAEAGCSIVDINQTVVQGSSRW